MVKAIERPLNNREDSTDVAIEHLETFRNPEDNVSFRSVFTSRNPGLALVYKRVFATPDLNEVEYWSLKIQKMMSPSQMMELNQWNTNEPTEMSVPSVNEVVSVLGRVCK